MEECWVDALEEGRGREGMGMGTGQVVEDEEVIVAFYLGV